MSEPNVCRLCGYFIDYVIPKAPAEPGWVHTSYRPDAPSSAEPVRAHTPRPLPTTPEEQR